METIEAIRKLRRWYNNPASASFEDEVELAKTLVSDLRIEQADGNLCVKSETSKTYTTPEGLRTLAMGLGSNCSWIGPLMDDCRAYNTFLGIASRNLTEYRRITLEDLTSDKDRQDFLKSLAVEIVMTRPKPKENRI